jgi:hypothetical protein
MLPNLHSVSRRWVFQCLFLVFHWILISTLVFLTITPVVSEGRIKWNRIPREPIPQLSDINLWVGQQLRHVNMPAKYLNVQPKGNLIPMDSTYPEGPNAEGQPRIIVPPAEVKALILQTHEDIHHQNHLKMLHVLKATYYWPNMAKDIERWCT